MLESMCVNPRPTRAECTDVANAVLDGADCVMLSGETAGGKFPVEAVRTMAACCVEAEGALRYDRLYENLRRDVLELSHRVSLEESVAMSAVGTALEIGAKCIVVLTQTGNTARLVAKYRPQAPILVLTPNKDAARVAEGLVRGATARVLGAMIGTENVLKLAGNMAKDLKWINQGDLYVCIHGQIEGITGKTNTMQVLTKRRKAMKLFHGLVFIFLTKSFRFTISQDGEGFDNEDVEWGTDDGEEWDNDDWEEEYVIEQPKNKSLDTCSVDSASEMKKLEEERKDYELDLVADRVAFSLSAKNDKDLEWREKQLPRYLRWAQKHGAAISDKVVLKRRDKLQSLGIEVVKDVSVGEEIFFIPKKIHMSFTAARENPILKEVLNHSLAQYKEEYLTKHFTLMFYLIHERQLGKRSFWGAFIRTLPRVFKTHPVFYGPEDRKFLTKSQEQMVVYIESVVQGHLSRARQLCEIFPTVLSGPLCTSQKAWKWAWVATLSRTLEGFGSESQLWLPLLDLANHCHHISSDIRFTEEGARIYSTAALKPGDEFCWRYSAEANSQNLFFAAFADLNLDSAGAGVYLHEAVFKKHESKELLVANEYMEEAKCFSLPLLNTHFIMNRPIPKTILTCLRLNHLVPSDMKKVTKMWDKKKSSLGYISKENEKASYEQLIHTLEKKMKSEQYSTFPREEDEKVCKDPNASINRKNLSYIRRAERIVMEYHLRKAREFVRCK
eukprot:g934.t1